MSRSSSLGVLVGTVLVASASIASAVSGTGRGLLVPGASGGATEKGAEAEGRQLTAEEADLVRWLDDMGNDQVHIASELLPALEAELGAAAFGGARWVNAEELQLMVVDTEGSLAWNAAAVWSESLALADGGALDGVDVVVSSVERSLAELDGIVAEIRQVIDGLVGPGRVASAGVRVEENAVEVEIVWDAVETVSKALSDRYGDAVRITPVDALGKPAADGRHGNVQFVAVPMSGELRHGPASGSKE